MNVPASVRGRPRVVGAAVALLVAALVAALVIAGCTSTISGRGSSAAASGGAPAGSAAPGSSGSTSSDAGERATFRDCRSAFNLGAVPFPAGRKAQLSFGCARVEVPLDYDDPSGRTIALQLVRIHSDATPGSRRSLLVNPGGPGASGIELAVSLAAQLSDSVLGTFDIVGFDPRGVGLSTPVSCISDATKDRLNAASYDVRTSAGFAKAKADAAAVARGCSAKYGSALAQFDTINTARDMDRIRIAVGDDSMNYLGFSYGTELGAQYARLFPAKVRTLVLDGAVNPLTDDITSFADQLQGFEKSFDQFAAYCRSTAPCSSLGDPRRAVATLAARATRSPVPSSATTDNRRATSSLVYLGILQALYSRSLWPSLATALQQGLAGDASDLIELGDQYNQRVDGKYSNISDANTTINCNDSEPGPSDATIRATASSWATRFPIFGLWSAPSLFSCQQWQSDRSPLPLPRAATARTVLVVGNVNDPATPYQGAKDLTRVMGNARLLTWVGQGHTSFLQGSSCIDDKVDAYLVRGTLPATGTTCRS